MRTMAPANRRASRLPARTSAAEYVEAAARSALSGARRSSASPVNGIETSPIVSRSGSELDEVSRRLPRQSHRLGRQAGTQPVSHRHQQRRPANLAVRIAWQRQRAETSGGLHQQRMRPDCAGKAPERTEPGRAAHQDRHAGQGLRLVGIEHEAERDRKHLATPLPGACRHPARSRRVARGRADRSARRAGAPARRANGRPVRRTGRRWRWRRASRRQRFRPAAPWCRAAMAMPRAPRSIGGRYR